MKGFFQYLLFLVYLGSLGIAFHLTHVFVVLKLGWFVFLPIGIFGAPIFLAFHIAKEHAGLAIAGLHLLLAIAIHPEIIDMNPMFFDLAEQHDVLNQTHNKHLNWWNRADKAYDLSLSLRTDMDNLYARENRLWYWVYPPSLVLIFWAILIFLFFPKDEEVHT